MKIGYYCESPADRAALMVFTEALLGAPPEPINMDLEARSVPGFFGALDGVFRGVHYGSDAEGLVVVVDCDESELHASDHDPAASKTEGCRFCKMHRILDRARGQLRPRQGKPELKVAIGLAVPAIEAWYLVGKNHQVGEPAWSVGLRAGRPPVTKQELKKLAYGNERASLEKMTECAEHEARRYVGDPKAIEAIATAFPAGFGLMAREIRSWSAGATNG